MASGKIFDRVYQVRKKKKTKCYGAENTRLPSVSLFLFVCARGGVQRSPAQRVYTDANRDMMLAERCSTATKRSRSIMAKAFMANT